METHAFFAFSYVSADTLRLIQPGIDRLVEARPSGQVKDELVLVSNAIRSHLQHAEPETLPGRSDEEDWLA